MATVGFADLKDTALPALWDEDVITKVRLADGSSFSEMVGQVRAGLIAKNRELLGMQHYSDMFAVQDPTDPSVEYPIGVSNGFEEATEYSVPKPKRGSTTGHMLPIKVYDRSVGWTMMYLMEARRIKLDADVQSVLHDTDALWQQKILTRLFLSTGNTVGTTSLADQPLADGGTSNSSYVPLPSPDGEEFTYTHNHFLGYSTSGITQNTIDQSAVEVALEHLQEHGHEAPYDLVGSRTDVSSWTNATNVTGWKPINWTDIAYHASAVERAGGMADLTQYFGSIETDYGIARVWLTYRVPTLHFAIYKSYGAGDQRNPLRVRYSSQWGFGYNIVPGSFVNSPLELLLVATKFGVGIGEDRTNGVCVDVAASTYSSPTIS